MRPSADTTMIHRLETANRALVVDDDTHMRGAMCAAVNEFGFDADDFASPEDAWDAFKNETYSLVLLDWQLPRISGIELCRRFRSLPHSPYVYILMVTANDSPEQLREALAAGADDYLMKPFHLHLLEIRLSVARMQIRHRIERARAEATILKERHFLQSIIDTIPSPIFYKDATGTYLGCNRAFEEMMARPRGEIVGKTAFDLAPREQADIYSEMDRNLLEGESGTQKYEAKVIDGYEKTRDVIFNKARFYNPDGAMGGIVAVMLDITDLKQAESALIRTQQLAAVGTLAAGVAHEFNNINTSILGFLELSLETSDLPETAREFLQIALSSGQRAATITKNLLAFSRATGAKKAPTDLTELVRNTLKIVAGEMHSEGVTLKLELEESPDIAVDPAQIAQVLINLVINARHAVIDSEEKVVTVATGTTETRIFIRVSDTGCGIEKAHLAKIFLPFFTTKGEHAEQASSQSKVRGTGLGLSVCDTIIRNHFGEITVDSQTDHGAAFTIWLPLTCSLEKQADTTRPDSERQYHPGGRLLVLDDEEEVRKLLQRILEIDGYEVVAIDDGQQALQLHAEQPFDLALVDLQMPKMNGIDFLRRMRHAENPAGVIVITGRYTEENLSQYDAEEVIATVQKPFDKHSLRSLVRRSLSDMDLPNRQPN